jgi:superfamily II DNA helicase RecQ
MATENINTTLMGYNFCPVGGIICSVCCYPISEIEDHVKILGKHEKRSKSHHSTLSLQDRKKIAAAFKEFIKKLASQILSALPNEDKARTILFLYCDDPKNFPFCTDLSCNKLVHCKIKHHSKQHISSCDKEQPGIKSKYWTKRQPKILSPTFSFKDKNNFCSDLWKAISDGQNQAQSLHQPDESKFQVYQHLLSKQEQQFTQQDQNITMQNIGVNKNADLWLNRTGWGNYFMGCLATDICNATKAFDTDNDVINIILEKNFETEVNRIIDYVRNINPLHQIFHEIERRPKKAYPNKPFRPPSAKTYMRYVSTMKMVLRVIIRVYNYQDTYDDNLHLNRMYPLMPFSTEQKEIIDKLKAHPDRNENYIDLLFELGRQTYNTHPYECVLVCSLAYISVNNDSTYKSAKHFTGTYAALLGIYKIIVIYRSMEEASDAKPVIELARMYTSAYLSHPEDMQSPNTLSYVINIFSYALVISKNSPSDGFIAWNGDVLVYENIRLSMIQFRSAILQNIVDAERLLLGLCEVRIMNQLPNIPWDSTYDNINNSDYNYSFLTEPRNKYTEVSKRFNDRRDMEFWMDVNNDFNAHHIATFKRTVKSFLEVLLFLVHTTGGQPARSTEIIILQHTNSSSCSIDGRRNIYIDRGLVCIYTRYHKSIIKMNQAKDIFRFLPPRVGTLMVYYLWLVLPHYQKVIGSCEKKHFKSTYVWTNTMVHNNEINKSWDGTKLSTCLQQCFSTKIGSDMNTSKYRHIAIAIVQRYLHTHITIKSRNDDFDDNDDENKDSIWDLQAAHSTNTRLNVYARKVGEVDRSSESIIDKYRIISMMWHDLIIQTHHVHQHQTSLLVDTLYQQRIGRLARLKLVKPEKMLQNFIGKNAKFRGNQENVICAIAHGTPNILQIAGTGVGKSMSFLLPAYTTISGTTIVIVPLKALQEDLVLRCSNHNLIAKIWDECDNYCNENIFFITPESASKPKFLDFLNLLKSQHQLDRIYIDECHLLLANSNTFRKKMDDLKSALKVANVQLVMLTATLPQKSEIDLFQRLDINDHVSIFRDSTVRKNIAYKVIEVARGNFVLLLKGILSTINNGRCIIYARTLDLGAQLSDELDCAHYHSNAENKKDKFDCWATSTNHPCILATSALGCGLDIPDIRYVIHVGCPGSLCDFAQESGRAGRDGQKSFSILLNIASMNFKVDDNDIREYIGNSKCRRIVLDSVLDGNVERKGCGADEELCDICSNQKEKDICDEMLKDLDVDFFDDDEFGIDQPHGHKEAIEDSEMVVQEEERRYKKMRIESKERAVTSHTISEMIDRFREAKCLACELSNRTNCPNQSEHSTLRGAARRRSLNFIGMYRRTRHKIEKYVVCFKCLCPQDICTQKFGDKGDCPNMFVMLDVIYLICILDNSMNRIEYNDTKHMLEIIRNYGHYEKTIRLVSIFHDMALSVVSKN